MVKEESTNTAEAERQSHTFKFVMAGLMGVGKTALVSRFTDDVFRVETLSTIGVDFAIKSMKASNGDTVKVQLHVIIVSRQVGCRDCRRLP
jgi:GTPase SAR1 family protein